MTEHATSNRIASGNEVGLLREVVYTPDAMSRGLVALVSEMFSDLRASLGLARQLLIRNLSARYRQTILGYFWAIIPALAMTLTFTFLKSSNILNLGETEIPYAAYVMSGTLLWAAFDGAIKVPLRVAIESIAMLTKVNFPREALLLAGLGEVLFDTSIRFLLLIPVYFYFAIPVPVTIIFAPLGFLAMMAAGLLVAMLLVPLAILYRDIQRGTELGMTALFFLTPVVYPSPAGGIASTLVGLNPLAPLLTSGRELLMTGSLSQPAESMMMIALTAIALPPAWLFFRLAMPHVIERVSA